MSNEDLLELARELNRRGEPYALVTVVRAIAPTSAYLGAQAIVPSPTARCTAGSAAAARKDVVIGARAKRDRRAASRSSCASATTGSRPKTRSSKHTMACASNGTIELFIQPYSARSALCVLGSTPAADEARFLAERHRIRLTESPERGARGAGRDRRGRATKMRSRPRCAARPGTCSMIASRRKADTLRERMRMRGIVEAQLARLQRPPAPDAGAKTPDEIALVAIVGVLALLRGRAARRCRRRAGRGGRRRRTRSSTPVGGRSSRSTRDAHRDLRGRVDSHFCLRRLPDDIPRRPGKIRGDPSRVDGQRRAVQDDAGILSPSDRRPGRVFAMTLPASFVSTTIHFGPGAEEARRPAPGASRAWRGRSSSPTRGSRRCRCSAS